MRSPGCVANREPLIGVVHQPANVGKGLIADSSGAVSPLSQYLSQKGDFAGEFVTLAADGTQPFVDRVGNDALECRRSGVSDLFSQHLWGGLEA